MSTSKLTAAFTQFAESERAGGILLAACTAAAFALANSPLGPAWLGLWQVPIAGLTLQLWVNDALMAVFFLLVGLELEREIHDGELSDFRAAMLPVVAAIGGMALPAAIHFGINGGTHTQPGAGIPMATDIAFALAALGLAGPGVPPSLRVFLTALAVIDDLGAIAVIGLAYSRDLSLPFLGAALAVFAVLVALNRRDVASLPPYVLGGMAMWYCLLHSGVHPTVGGVLLAFAMPFAPRRGRSRSLSARVEEALQRPVALGVLPAFALANGGVTIPHAWIEQLMTANSVGIFAGLLIGKPLGIVLACLLAVSLGICKLPADLRWSHVVGGGILAGIGFTMSIFIANLAFPVDASLVNTSKMAILAASLGAMLLGAAWLRTAKAESGE